MHENPYDFSKFLARMCEMSYPEILLDGDREVREVEQSLSHVRGAPKRRELGGGVYAERIKKFLFFLRYGQKPGGVEESDFRAYRAVVKSLVEKGQFKPEALMLFGDAATKDQLNLSPSAEQDINLEER